MHWINRQITTLNIYYQPIQSDRRYQNCYQSPDHIGLQNQSQIKQRMREETFRELDQSSGHIGRPRQHNQPLPSPGNSREMGFSSDHRGRQSRDRLTDAAEKSRDVNPPPDHRSRLFSDKLHSRSREKTNCPLSPSTAGLEKANRNLNQRDSSQIINLSKSRSTDSPRKIIEGKEFIRYSESERRLVGDEPVRYRNDSNKPTRNDGATVERGLVGDEPVRYRNNSNKPTRNDEATVERNQQMRIHESLDTENRPMRNRERSMREPSGCNDFANDAPIRTDERRVCKDSGTRIIQDRTYTSDRLVAPTPQTNICYQASPSMKNEHQNCFGDGNQSSRQTKQHRDTPSQLKQHEN